MKMKTMISIILMSILPCSYAMAAPATGKIADITSTGNTTSTGHALLIRISDGQSFLVPSGCPNDWLRINENDKIIISLTMTAWTIGKDVTVYAKAFNATEGPHCIISQVDPAG